ncbi:autotransporter-associated beta strand repeat-containing protein [Luteolibacter sp. SL250]|uniref:beta strand repeat-containing protein n=1 Tax=Luteolibacter sp. SL250 TaxID=2995170 RepID=UPI00226E4AB8|nr:autotransporter-associated beta strand repeat-containing protein [Luteolibacter sp. SL250]WAC18767.1 autotransporter-associated beta strand repeat-containing protein [Luteolibacter sp. SL250]
MKPLRFSALVRGVTACTAAVFTLSSIPASAVPYWWDGTAADNDWGNASNWSDSSTANANPTVVPGALDTANLTASGLTGPFNINLNGNRAVDGIVTTNLASLATLLGGSGSSTLAVGAGGINHSSGGGLTIGSATAGQEVNLSLTGNQKWTSSAAGTGQAAIIINNTVSNGVSGGDPVTLTLGGINQNAIINGAISNASGTVNLIKADTGIWTLANAANTVGTTQVNAGTLRLLNATTLNPAATTVASGATLSLRVAGAAGFTTTQVDDYRSGVTFNSGSTLGLDTANGDFTYNSNITGTHNLNKLGGNTLTLGGANTYTGTTTISEGALAIANISAYNGNTLTVANGAILMALSGGSNLTTAQIDSLRTAATYSAGGVFGINTTNGDYTYGSTMTGALRFQKSGTNTLFLTGNNSHIGGVNVSGGILSVDNIRNGGQAGALGTSSNAATNLNLAGGRLRYTGTGDTTNRLFQVLASSTIDSSGTGALIFSNTGTNTTGTGTANARTLTLTGYNKDANTIAGVITNSGGSPNVTNLTKYGSGNWTLSGANTFTGAIRPNGGVLTLDYGTSDPLASAATILINQGAIEFKGKSTGVTTDTISSLMIGDGNNGLGRVILNGNGGSGVQLTITTLTGTGGNSQRHDLIDLSGNAGNSITVGTLAPAIVGPPAVAAPLAMVNGVLMNVNGGRANIILRDTDGSYGFAALSGPTSGTLQKVAAANQTVLSAGSVNMATSTANYVLNAAGTYTQQATTPLVFNTLTVDSTAGAVTLDMGANAITAAGSGKGMLFSGSNDISITGTSTAFGGSALWFHNYIADGKVLDISASFGTGNFMIVGGTGTTLYSGTGLAGTFILDGGLFRASTAQNTTATLRINSGGVFEIGADLNGTGAGDLTKALGTAAGNIQFTGDAGLSAHGGNRVVNFGGASAGITWGQANFLTFGDATDGDYTFKLSSVLSDSNIEIQNGINLNGKTRVVEVANGSAAVDATLSGALSGDLSAGLIKTGAGTLSLTGTNTYQGATRVDAGRLIIGSGGINASTSIQVRNATLEFGAQTAANTQVNDNAVVTLQNAMMITNGTNERFGPMAISGPSQIQLGGSNILNIADSSAQSWTSTLAILDWGGFSLGGGDDQIYFGDNASGLTTSQLSMISFINPTVDGQGYTGSFSAGILADGEIIPLIPEPSVTGLALLGAAGVLLRRRRKA